MAKDTGNDKPKPRPTPGSRGGNSETKVGDVREEFIEITRRTPKEKGAEQAFILAKIESLKNDPRLTPDQKKEAIDKLKTLLSKAGEGEPPL